MNNCFLYFGFVIIWFVMMKLIFVSNINGVGHGSLYVSLFKFLFVFCQIFKQSFSVKVYKIQPNRLIQFNLNWYNPIILDKSNIIGLVFNSSNLVGLDRF